MSWDEINRIKMYVNELPKEKRSEIWSYIKDNKSPKCQFRDDKNKRCTVYAARPLICRIYGVVDIGRCKHGNTHNIPMPQLLTEKYVYEERFLITGMVWKEDDE